MIRSAIFSVVSAGVLAVSAIPALASEQQNNSVTPGNVITGGGNPGDAVVSGNPGAPCPDCPKPRPSYDSQEVVHTTRDVDHSRVINTVSEVPVAPRVKEHNHLLIRKNTIRNVGVVQHNHTIIEKEIRYRRPVRKPVKAGWVTHKYYTYYQPKIVYVPVTYAVRYAVPYPPCGVCYQPQHHHPQHHQPHYPQYQPPQYQVPQYQYPQYQVQHHYPQYQVPQYQYPQYQVPQYQVPQYPHRTGLLQVGG